MFKKDQELLQKHLQDFQTENDKLKYESLIDELYDIVDTIDDKKYAKDLEKYILIKPYSIENLAKIVDYYEAVYNALNYDKWMHFDTLVDHYWRIEDEFLEWMYVNEYKTYNDMKETILEEDNYEELLEEFEEINSSGGAKFAYQWDGDSIVDWYKYRRELLREFYRAEFETANSEFFENIDES